MGGGRRWGGKEHPSFGVTGMTTQSELCTTCGGSGKSPAGLPLIEGSGWLRDEPPFRQVGWTWTTNNTAPLPPCLACQGTGRKKAARRVPAPKQEEPVDVTGLVELGLVMRLKRPINVMPYSRAQGEHALAQANPERAEAAAALARLQHALDKIGDAVSLVIDGNDCTVEGFCTAIHEYQMDSIKLDKAEATIARLQQENERLNNALGYFLMRRDDNTWEWNRNEAERLARAALGDRARSGLNERSSYHWADHNEAQATIASLQERYADVSMKHGRLSAALEKIKHIKSEPIGDTGFSVGPLALLDACQQVARAALSEE